MDDERVSGVNVVSVVDDDESIRNATAALLRSAGYNVATFASGDVFLASGVLAITTCLVLDMRMPHMNGLELQRLVTAQKATVQIIFVTGHPELAQRQKAMEAGAFRFLYKPFEPREFLAAIQAAVNRQELRSRPQDRLPLKSNTKEGCT